MRKYIMLIIAGTFILSMQAFTDNKAPASKEALGKLLFFDPILSKDSTISCASCHLPAFAFADTAAVSVGVGGAKGVRNTPSAMNMLLQRALFWDGRAKDLEAQALMPIENPVEMNLPLDSAVYRLRQSKLYSAYFKKIFKRAPDRGNLASAIAAFERTLETSDSPFDEWKYADKEPAVSEAAKRGFMIFNNNGKCNQCHFGPNLGGNEFRNIGLFNGRELNDSGQAVITRKLDDLGKFKVPALRNVGVTAPYMHDGRMKTLEEVIDFYNEPDKVVGNSINRDSLLARPLGLTDQDKSDLLAFLRSLTDNKFAAVRR